MPKAVTDLEHDAGLGATPAEIKHLYFFHDGAIQSSYVRDQLHRSWGFCPRHTWLHAIVERELRHWTYTTAILYEDLIGRAARTLHSTRAPASLTRQRLRSRSRCLVCSYVELASPDPAFSEMATWVNRLEETRPLIGSLAPNWQPRSCPLCLGGYGPICRPHLLSGVEVAMVDVAFGLDEIHARLHTFVKSMTYRCPLANDDERASWIDALGWFAGWSLPAVLATER